MNRPMTTIWTIAAIMGFSSLTACSGAELEGGTGTELSSHTESLTLANTEPGAAAPESKRRAGKERFFERFDTNKNGAIEVAELPEHKREHLSKLDADKNGVLSKDELAAWHEGKRRKGKRHFDLERFDANKNGTIEVSEIPEKMKERLAKADNNADGILSAEELQAHRKAFMQQKLTSKDINKDGALTAEEAGERKWAKLSLADADKDGKVTFAEIEQARESGHLKHRGR